MHISPIFSCLSQFMFYLCHQLFLTLPVTTHLLCILYDLTSLTQSLVNWLYDSNDFLVLNCSVVIKLVCNTRYETISLASIGGKSPLETTPAAKVSIWSRSLPPIKLIFMNISFLCFWRHRIFVTCIHFTSIDIATCSPKWWMLVNTS